jgi:hypothetical protein
LNSSPPHLTKILKKLKLYIFVVYKPPKMKILCFNSILETILKYVPKDFPIILIGEFNIDILKKTPQSTKFQNLMEKYNLKFILSKSTTINNTQINNIWINAPTQQCHLRVTKAYWIDHELVHFTLKLLHYVLQFFYHKYITHQI